MNASHLTPRQVAVFTLAGLASGLVSQSSWAVDCSKPAGLTERLACAKAAEGIVALQRYAERTRAVHNLYLPDYEKALPARDLAQSEHAETVEVAQADRR